MTMHHLLIELTSKTRRLIVPPDLEALLLTEYGWEPEDGIFWNPAELMDIIETSCKKYRKGELDVSIPDEATVWKSRAEKTAFVLQGILLEKEHLETECRRMMELLDENGIPY